MATHSVVNLKNATEQSYWHSDLKILLPMVGVYLILAFYGIDQQSLWEDEFKSVQRGASSTIPFWRDGHGFLYFALLGLWMKIGSSELVLRSLSVLFGAGSVCLMYAMGLRLLNRRGAIVGTVLLATSPYFIWYSQEARYVTLMLLSSLLTMYAFHRVIIGHSIGSWLAYGTSALVAFFSFLSTLLLPVVQVLFLLGSRSRRRLLPKWVLCQLVILPVFVWWFVNGTHFWGAFVEARVNDQQGLVNNPRLFPFSANFNNVRAEVIPYTFFALNTGFSLGPSPRELYADRTLAPLVPYAPMLVILSALYGSLLISGLLAFRHQRDSGMFLALWVGVPIIAVFYIAKLLNLFYDVRYVAMVLPAYMLILAAGISRFRRVGMQLILVGAVLVIHSVALGNYYFNPRYAREDTRAAARYLESVAAARDLVLVVGTISSLPHYYNGSPRLIDFRALNKSDQTLTERLRELNQYHDRVWLVQIRPWQTDPSGMVKAALDRAFDVGAKRHFAGIDVYAYASSN